MEAEAAATVDAGEDEGDKKTEGMGDLVFGISRFMASMRLLAIRLANGRQLTAVMQPNITSIVMIIAMEESDASRSRVPICEEV